MFGLLFSIFKTSIVSQPVFRNNTMEEKCKSMNMFIAIELVKVLQKNRINRFIMEIGYMIVKAEISNLPCVNGRAKKTG